MKLRDELFKVTADQVPNLEEIKQDHRRKYKAAYQKDYRRKKVRKEVCFDPEELKVIEMEAVKYGLPLATFLRKATIAFTMQVHLIPPQEEQMWRYIQELLLRIGNNVNQVAKRCNTNQMVTEIDHQALQALLLGLEKEIQGALKNRPDFIQTAKEAIQADPRIAEQLGELLATHNNSK